jgi:hypothetical protein
MLQSGGGIQIRTARSANTIGSRRSQKPAAAREQLSSSVHRGRESLAIFFAQWALQHLKGSPSFADEFIILRGNRVGCGCPIWTEDTDFFGCGVAIWTSNSIDIFLTG